MANPSGDGGQGHFLNRLARDPGRCDGHDQAAIAPLDLGKAWPHQTQSLQDTLASYTRDNAWAEFAEGSRGRLAEGMDADIAVLSHDITQYPAEAVTNVNAIAAIMDGQITFQRGVAG